MADNRVRAIAARPEAELLLCCARTHMETERAERIRQLLREDIDWNYLMRLASQHGVMPLLSWHLSAICPEAVPPAPLHQLQHHFHAIVQHNLFLTGELMKLLNLLEEQGIGAVPFKGPVLAATAYKNLALRQFGDLDILVREKDFVKTKGLLIAQGYRPWCQLTEAQEIHHLQSAHAYTFVGEDKRVRIDLHWRLVQKRWAFRLDSERLWERLEQIPLAGRMVPTLPAEEMLLVLCMHGAKHSWERLGWICDIAEMVRTQKGVDYGRVMEQADRLHSKRMLVLGLYLTKELLGASLPEQVCREIKIDSHIQSLAFRAYALLFSEAPNLLRDGKRVAFYFRIKERLQDRVPFLLHHLRKMLTPNVKDFTLLPLPVLLSFLYIFFRPLRLIATYGWLSLKRLFVREVSKDSSNN